MPELACQCRRYLIVLYIFLIVVVLPALVLISVERELENKEKTALVGGVFVILALPISLCGITQHMIYYSRPTLQKHIIRILWMVPIYALNGWLGLVWPNQGIFVNCARECYEAYVIYNFLVYLLNYLNAEMDLEINLALKPQIKHTFPLCCLPNWKMGRELVYKCKHGILQYTVIRPVTAFISFICEECGVYGESDFRFDVAYPYMAFINNLSQFMAMYCLYMFYRANKGELRPMKPIGKFFCIKSVVFFSFFQSVIISFAAYCDLLDFLRDPSANTKESTNALSNKIQNFLICIEMFIAAIAHKWCFTHEPFVNDLVEKRTLWDAFMAMWDISDVEADLREHFGAVGSSLSSPFSRVHSSVSDGETSALISPSTPPSGYNTHNVQT